MGLWPSNVAMTPHSRSVFVDLALLSEFLTALPVIRAQENGKEEIKGVLPNGDKVMDVTKLTPVRIAVVHLP